MPANPSPFSLSSPTYSGVSMTWGSVGGVTGYRVYRKRPSVGSATYVLVYEGTALAFADTVANFDIDTAGTVAGEEWKFLLVSYDGGGESSGVEATATMPAQTASDITNVGIKDPPYNDGADQVATYTITNPDTVTATVTDDSKLMHETRLRTIDAYGRNAAN